MAITNVTDVQKNTTTSKSSTKKNSSNVSYDSYTKKTYTYTDIFKAASKKYNISQELLEAVAYTESSFRANATSYCGAQGLMQLMPATAKSLGVNDAYNPVENIMGGAKYLSQMLKKYNGDVSLALAAYNGGPGNVAKYGGVPSFCKSYVNKVTSLMKKGVDVPNKTITVDNSSKAASLMSGYNVSDSSNKSNIVSTAVDDTKKTSVASSATKAYEKYNKSQLYSVSDISNEIDYAITSNDTISYNELFEYAASKYNLPTNLLISLAQAESNFDANATSKSGAMGIMQLMPGTAKSLGVKDGYNPIENVLGGAKYLAQMMKKYNNNQTLAVAAYNAGMGNVAKYNGVPSFAKSFVDKVISNSKKGINVPNKAIDVSSYVDSDISKANELLSQVQELYKNESNMSNKDKEQIFSSLIKKYGSYNNIVSILSKMSTNVNNSYDLVDMLGNISNYYV